MDSAAAAASSAHSEEMDAAHNVTSEADHEFNRSNSASPESYPPEEEPSPTAERINSLLQLRSPTPSLSTHNSSETQTDDVFPCDISAIQSKPGDESKTLHPIDDPAYIEKTRRDFRSFCEEYKQWAVSPHRRCSNMV